MPRAPGVQHRVRFDFEVEFLNGGALQGQDFRLDLPGDTISDDALADYLVRDLRLLMVRTVRILNRQVIQEAHKRAPEAAGAAGAAGRDPAPAGAGSGADPAPTGAGVAADPRGVPATEAAGAAAGRTRRFVDLSHTIESGMRTYPGMPAPIIGDHLSYDASRAHYGAGTEFQIGRIEMVANTGTYIDSPFHRFRGGADLSGLELAALADVPGVLVRVTGAAERAIGHTAFAATEVRGRAVLVHTGWARHWRTEAYFSGHPFLTAGAAEYLRDRGAVLVGIDSLNIDDTDDLHRPVHTTLLGAGIPIVEHLCGLEHLPVAGFRFAAVPPKVRGMGSFPVRAYAVVLPDRS